MTPKQVASNNSQPKYLQIYHLMEEQIRSGTLKPGDQLPSFTDLREKYGAMPTTAERVYARLEKENLVVRKPRRGVFVAPRERSLTGTIGLVLHSASRQSTSNDLRMQLLLDGIRAACRENHTEILLLDDEDALRPDKTDGLILYCDKLEAYALGLTPATPHVLLFQNADDLTSVTVDDFGGTKLATRHLIEHGHQRIACLTEEFLEVPTQRRAGCRAALEEAGIAVEARWLRQCKKMEKKENSPYLAWGRKQMEDWLADDWNELGCTAIVVQNDVAAIGVMQALQEHGIDVPGQVSVMGFDGTDICDLAYPRLSSVKVPLYQVGQEAVRTLLSQIHGGVQAPRNITLPVSLRSGNSVAQARSTS
jgi:DNA-binding LacI/PurR family transcriptional regulator